jgi:hypothetical protein
MEMSNREEKIYNVLSIIIGILLVAGIGFIVGVMYSSIKNVNSSIKPEEENEVDLGIIPDDDRLQQMTDMQLVMWVLADLYNQWMDDNLSNELRKRSDERTFDEHHKEKNND